jgi:hypothetical protein
MKDLRPLIEDRADHRLPERLVRLVVRRGLSVDDLRGMLVRGEKIRGVGPVRRAWLEEALGSSADGRTVPDNRRNTDLWSPGQWGRIAARAELAGYGDQRLSALPELVQAGLLRHPDVPGGTA